MDQLNRKVEPKIFNLVDCSVDNPFDFYRIHSAWDRSTHSILGEYGCNRASIIDQKFIEAVKSLPTPSVTIDLDLPITADPL